MLGNYFKVALRYLLRHKGYTLINILGLGVGIASCLLIMIFVRNEFSYDAFHSRSNRLYRVWQDEKTEGKEFINTVTSLAAGPALKNSFPEVEAMSRVYNFNSLVRINDHSFNEQVTAVDPDFFKMFDFQLLSGPKTTPLSSPNAILLTPAMEKKYFGSDQAIGKNLQLQLGDDKILFTVAGIIQQSPEASSIKYDFLISFDNAKYLFRPRMLTSWFNVFDETYVLLRDPAGAAQLEKKFPSMLKKEMGKDYGSEEYNLYLQPITAIHLDTHLPAGNLPTSDPKYAYILGSIGLLILLVACINFITLSVGRSVTRALEVGVRKTLGAGRTQLMRQFWGEACLLTILSFIVGVLLAFLLIAPFNRITGLSLPFQIDTLFIVFSLGLILLIALIAGIYPALVLSGFQPIEVLKGKLKLGGDGTGWLRKGLIVAQFTASIIMIICTLVISDQMKYMQDKNLGFNKEQVIIVPTNKKRADGFSQARLYRAELLKHPEVIDVASSTFSLAESPWATLGFSDEKKAYHSFQYNEVDPYFLPLMQIQMQSGKTFDPNNSAEFNNSIIVNDALVKEYGIKDPVGKKFGRYSQQIIGVMKDFNYESLHTAIKPLVISLNADTIIRQSEDVSFALAPQPRISVRMKAGNPATNLRILEKAWKQIAPGQDFQYYFLDQSLAAAYQQEQKSSTIIKTAALLSIFIACMGLFGLATLTVARRTKEIGIRKVMGASTSQIVKLLSKDFIVLVAIAAVIAFPVAGWAMHSWLADFAYRTSMSIWIFVVSGCSAIIIALLTVSYNAIKAALENPVKSLQTE